ncbi:MAG TPA: ABC transporter substrate-binding protein [Chloroflexota bacterium]|nr:ABC transporter substrate-binding protein [Chloroflexota bacterium]
MNRKAIGGIAALLLAGALLAGCGSGGGAAPGASSTTGGAPSGAAPGGAAGAAGGGSGSATPSAGGAASPSAASGGAAPAAAGAPVAVKFGLPVPSVNSLDMFIADQRGFLREQGLDVEIIISGPASQTIQAMVGNSLDIATPVPDGVINANEKGADLVFIAGEFNRAVYSLIGSKDVHGYADLKGKTLAVSDLRDGTTTLLRRMLQQNGIGRDDVDLVPLGGTPNRAAAVTSGQAAATLLSQPQDFRLMADGYPRLGLSTDAVRDYFFQGHAARRSWLRDNADTAVRFLRAIIAADRFMYDPANRETVISLLADGTKSGQEESSQTYDLIIVREQALSKEGELSPEGIQNVIAILGETGVLEPPLPTADKYYDLSYLERATTASSGS